MMTPSSSHQVNLPHQRARILRPARISSSRTYAPGSPPSRLLCPSGWTTEMIFGWAPSRRRCRRRSLISRATWTITTAPGSRCSARRARRFRRRPQGGPRVAGRRAARTRREPKRCSRGARDLDAGLPESRTSASHGQTALRSGGGRERDPHLACSFFFSTSLQSISSPVATKFPSLVSKRRMSRQGGGLLLRKFFASLQNFLTRRARGRRSFNIL